MDVCMDIADVHMDITDIHMMSANICMDVCNLCEGPLQVRRTSADISGTGWAELPYYICGSLHFIGSDRWPEPSKDV